MQDRLQATVTWALFVGALLWTITLYTHKYSKPVEYPAMVVFHNYHLYERCALPVNEVEGSVNAKKYIPNRKEKRTMQNRKFS